MSAYNPYQYGYPQYNYQPQQQNVYAIVNGIEGAKQYPVAINQTILLMDSNEPIAYKKSANGLGQTTIEAYRLVPIVDTQPEQPQVEYALKSDLDKITKKLDSLYKKITQNSDKEIKADA